MYDRIRSSRCSRLTLIRLTGLTRVFDFFFSTTGCSDGRQSVSKRASNGSLSVSTGSHLITVFRFDRGVLEIIC